MLFFFKQKTAYEMRISDLSSVVCSSDLIGVGSGGVSCGLTSGGGGGGGGGRMTRVVFISLGRSLTVCLPISVQTRISARPIPTTTRMRPKVIGDRLRRGPRGPPSMLGRSEEHTSELQSLMRH